VTMGKKQQPLSGVRVLDLSRVLSGPFCTMMLADLGAEVIKVEIPGRGDDARYAGPPFIQGESVFFISINRNKKSITLNLKKRKGVEILHKLAQKSDVLVENFRPGVVNRLEIDYESIKSINPQIIYCSISAYGQTGPYRDRPGYNFTVQALSGVMTVSGEIGSAPMPVGISLGDIPAGMFAAYAIVAALFAREQTGKGAYIDISMLDSLLALMENPLARYAATKEYPKPIGRYNPSITPFGVFETKDKPIVITIGNDKLWKKFCSVIGLKSLVEDPRFRSNPERTKNRDELHKLLSDRLTTKPAAYWLELFWKNGLPAAPVYTVADVFKDPQIKARQMLIRVRQPLAGETTLVGCPIKIMTGFENTTYTPAPLLGQHTEEILTNLLGLLPGEISELKEEGVL